MLQITEQHDDLLPNLFGGKAANISKMVNMGFNVPKAFVIPTSKTFDIDFKNGKCYNHGSTFHSQLLSQVRYLAQQTNSTWASQWGDPLIVSVRSGAPVSMPGMMDTILNIGLTKDNLDTFAKSREASKSFALDCYRRLIQMYGVTVKNVDPSHFNKIFDATKTLWLNEIPEHGYAKLVDAYEQIYLRETGEIFPDDPNVQLLEATNAVFRSWFSEKACNYRAIENISDKLGTAVLIQQMVFGNLDNSATGVAFTHNPNTGEKGLYGDYLAGAQGEDVVSGAHKVYPINEMLKQSEFSDACKQLQSYMMQLLNREKDILDIEFTIERGKLYMLQYRIAKRSQRAEIRTIIDMVKSSDISAVTATNRFLQLLPKPDSGLDLSEADLTYVGRGVGATEGIVTGRIAVGHEQADIFTKEGIPYVYVASETAPEDSVQMKNSVGILTALGGKLSHAAVVARGWNKSCVVSLPELKMLPNNKGCSIAGFEYLNGHPIKINGATGEVWA
jgi:pyruvate,orthophosphate dikinase